MTNDLVHGLLEVGDEALWIWSHAFIASTLGGSAEVLASEAAYADLVSSSAKARHPNL